MRKNILLALAATLLTLLLLEAGVRSYQYFARGMPFLVIGGSGSDPTAITIRGHPLFHFVPNPSLPDVDEDYFRYTGSPAQAPLRIATLGGSTTYDTAVPADGSYPFLLREALARRGISSRVLNGGGPGYQLAHITSRYVHQIRHMLRPGDWVLIDVGFNDTYLHAGLADTRRGHAAFMRVVDDDASVWRNSRLLNVVRARLDQALCASGREGLFEGNIGTMSFRGHCTAGPRIAPDPAAIARYGGDLAFLVRMMRADGLRPVLLLQDYVPSRVERDFAGVIEPLRVELARVAAVAGAAVLDMRDVTRGRPELFDDQIHLLRRGNEMRAAAVAAMIAGAAPAPRSPR